jgi:hypothetical protein
MNSIRPLIFTLLFSFSLLINAQTSENPWAIAVGADFDQLARR